MTDLPLASAIVVAAYFVGSIPVGLLVSRARGIDIRAVGSGNIGATNVARGLGARLGLLVLVFDAVKGAIPMLVVAALDLASTVDPLVVTATGFAAIAGHCFPIWLRFRGGKGVATSLGVYLALDPLATGLAVVAFAAAFAPWRIVAVGSIAAATAMPIIMLLLHRSDAAVTLAIAVALVVVYRHRGNLAGMLRRDGDSVE